MVEMSTSTAHTRLPPPLPLSRPGVMLYSITPGLDKGHGGGRRVCAVEVDISTINDVALESSWPASRAQSSPDSRLRQVNAGRGDVVQGRQGGARVLDLMGAGNSER